MPRRSAVKFSPHRKHEADHAKPEPKQPEKLHKVTRLESKTKPITNPGNADKSTACADHQQARREPKLTTLPTLEKINRPTLESRKPQESKPLNMEDNIIKLINGVEVTKEDIYRIADEYIYNVLDAPEDITHKRNTFYGCLKYIYSKLFQPSKTDRILNNQSCLVAYSDIFSLYSLYDCFIDLCCKYHMEFTQNSFTFFSGITIDTLENWKNNKRIPDNTKGLPINLWADYAKKIFNNSEISLHNSMLDGNLMAYATLKCWYGWTETPQQIAITSTAPAQNAASIAQKYNALSIAPPPTNADFLSVPESNNIQENV